MIEKDVRTLGSVPDGRGSSIPAAASLRKPSKNFTGRVKTESTPPGLERTTRAAAVAYITEQRGRNVYLYGTSARALTPPRILPRHIRKPITRINAHGYTNTSRVMAFLGPLIYRHSSPSIPPGYPTRPEGKHWSTQPNAGRRRPACSSRIPTIDGIFQCTRLSSHPTLSPSYPENFKRVNESSL